MSFPMTSSAFDLRQYQIDAVRRIEEAWNQEGWKHVLLVLPTGCGKTVVFNTIAARQPGRTLILAHRDELIEQARDKYQRMFGIMPGKIKASENDIRQVTVGSVQTMCRRDYSGQFDTIIVDEAHHAVSPSYQTVLGQFPEANVLGVTATPDRGDKKNLGTYFDGIAYEYSLKTAVKEGFLCEIRAKTIPLEIDLSSTKVSMGDFEVNSIAATLEPYLPQIAQAIAREAAARKTVVFCPLISIAQNLASMIPGAREVNGTSEDRKEVLDWFDKAGPGAVLCNAMLLTEGWDCPSCDCVVVLRPTKIRALYCQMVGRGTRLFPGKDNLLILDFLWLSMKHNLCKPACLVSENEEDIQAVTQQSVVDDFLIEDPDSGFPVDGIDLFGAVSDAENARRNRLAEELAKQTRKKAELINPLELFALMDDIGLADYEPAFKWEEADATAKQIQALKNFGIDAEGITKGYASQILDRLISRSRRNMATVKQIKLLKRFGYNPADWSFEQASKKIAALKAAKWKPWRVRD